MSFCKNQLDSRGILSRGGYWLEGALSRWYIGRGVLSGGGYWPVDAVLSACCLEQHTHHGDVGRKNKQTQKKKRGTNYFFMKVLRESRDCLTLHYIYTTQHCSEKWRGGRTKPCILCPPFSKMMGMAAHTPPPPPF